MEETRHILIADDDSTFRNITAALLRRQGYECECASDARVALAKLRARSFDLLIADIEMPENDQLALLRSLPPSAEGMPVILATAFPTVQTAIQSIQLPVAAYLVKPFEGEQLLTEVRKALDRHRAYQAVRHSEQRLQAWTEDLKQIKTVLETRAGTLPPSSFATFSALTLRNIIDSLLDLKRFTEAVAPASPSLQHIEVLCEAIAVLDKTKRSFKSKELGELRKKLQAHLGTALAK